MIQQKIYENLCHAVIQGDTKTVELLLEDSQYVHIVDSTWGNLLNNAVIHGHKQIAELLISKGADVNSDVYGPTGLHHAAEQGNNRIIEMLIG